MSQGDLNHPILINSNDEIGELSEQINNLRLILKDNFATEEANRKANYELVTALSHDIRTPLTSLMGYLDIIRLKKYRNDEQYNLYLNNSIDKVNQINELANKMFEYFLVFSKEQDTELTKMSLGVIYEYMIENIDVLNEHGFIIEKSLEPRDAFIRGNINLIKRIINNIFSNLLKYANINQPVYIKMTTDENNLKLVFKNQKKNTTNYIESNQIGLRSVQQMLKIHDGSFMVVDDENTFNVTITKFEKVSVKQFLNDFKDSFPEYHETTINEIYDSLTLPKRATVGSAGYDFYTPIDFILKPNETIKIPTGIRVSINEGWFLAIFPRSGLGFKYRLQLNNTVGIIDSDYYYSDNEGHIFIKITNDSNENKTVEIKKGQGFAQGIFMPFGICEDDDTDQQRNGGFGSTTK